MKKASSLAKKLARKFCVTNGSKFRLNSVHPGSTAGVDVDDKAFYEDALRESVKSLSDLQERLYAQNRWAALFVFQAMDAAGKDGAIRHVMSGINPQGCQVSSFKEPSAEELDHDFLWRCQKQLPERGRIGIFNRSYYEEVLVVRVHPEYLLRQQLPPGLSTKNIWKQRFKDIRHFESTLAHNGTAVRKIFLHVSAEEQKRRFLARLDDPAKNWKFSEGDVAERQHWKEYMAAYEDMIRNTATPEAPWYVIPADSKPFARFVVSALMLDTLQSLKPTFPTLDAEHRKALQRGRTALLRERPGKRNDTTQK